MIPPGAALSQHGVFEAFYLCHDVRFLGVGLLQSLARHVEYFHFGRRFCRQGLILSAGNYAGVVHQAPLEFQIIDLLIQFDVESAHGVELLALP
jgi:hypothetical protein